MSIEAIKSFIDRLNTDEDFLKKVTKCKDPEACMVFAKREGFELEMAELLIAV